MKIGILWDLDGTLLDTLEDLKDAVNYTLRHYGCPERSLLEARRFVGNGARNLIMQSLPGLPGDPDLEEALQTYQIYYNAHSQVKTCPYPGVLEALQILGEKYPMAVVSNKPDDAVKPLCAQYFGTIYARGEQAGCPRKPAPDMVHRTMADLGVEKCLYVGDSEVDIVTANNAGVPCLSVTWGFRDREVLEQAGGTHFCDDPAKLVDAVEELCQGLGKI